MTVKNNKPTLRNATRPESRHVLNLSRAVHDVERTGEPVAQSTMPTLRLRDALIDEK
ncbi:MAG: hypothetical protein OXG05_15240 [Gammaproteobacteria bacterium]|nr:hypothetical protein [Gammaproteobacteria bacterium]